MAGEGPEYGAAAYQPVTYNPNTSGYYTAPAGQGTVNPYMPTQIAGPGFAAATAPATNALNPTTPTTDPLAALYAQYFGAGASGPGGSGGGTSGAPYTSNIMDKLLAAESQYIPEMLSGGYRSTTAGEAAYESAAGPINAKYDSLKQQVLQNAAMQGVNPDSGIVQDQLDSVDQQRTEALSGLEQQFNASLPQRQEAGLSQLTNLQGMQEQQALQSLGIQQSLDEAQRQRLLDAASLSGNQGASAAESAASQAGNLLNAAAGLSGVYYNRAANQAAGLGSMLGSMGNTFGQSYDPAAMYNQYGGNVNNDPYYTNMTNVYGPDVSPYSSMTPGTPGYTGPAAGQ